MILIEKDIIMGDKVYTKRLKCTKHGAQRMQQRGILKEGVDTILLYGSEVRENEFVLLKSDIEERVLEIKFDIGRLRNEQRKNCGRREINELSSEERAKQISVLRIELRILGKNKDKKIITSERGIVTGYPLTKRSQKSLKQNKRYKKW